MKDKLIAISIIVFLVGGAFGFLGGVKFQQAKTSSQTSARLGQPGARQGTGQGRFGNGGGAVVGQILSMDNKSITVKLNDGSSKIVIIPSSVTISKTDAATQGDLKVGAVVGVFGTSNSDGTVTAQTIQLNPTFRGAQGATQSGKNN